MRVLVLAAGVIVFLLVWNKYVAPYDRACVSRGGTYFLNGHCVRITYEPISLKEQDQ